VGAEVPRHRWGPGEIGAPPPITHSSEYSRQNPLVYPKRRPDCLRWLNPERLASPVLRDTKLVDRGNIAPAQSFKCVTWLCEVATRFDYVLLAFMPIAGLVFSALSST
jgi:hypothetical protein